MKISKYEFNDEASALSKIASLPHATDEDGNDYPTHKNTIVHLGNIVLEQGEYDSEGKETKAPVLSSKWHLDVLWAGEEGHPYGWATRAIDLDNEGSHSFLGVSYVSNKM